MPRKAGLLKYFLVALDHYAYQEGADDLIAEYLYTVRADGKRTKVVEQMIGMTIGGETRTNRRPSTGSLTTLAV